jgi:wyosine [tRNA(Phe)-imidazoG37] synthetase (radical SAM superfamily)
VFGPVPSRRLGRSLGIDPIPVKTCNFNCVYCQLGRTAPLTNQRLNYISPDEIGGEIEQAIGVHRRDEIDWVTVTGSGEPTLHASLGWIIRRVQAVTDLPVAVLTNGSLLHRSDVREELMAADAVLPSLDAGGSALYRAVNRPFPQCTFERLVEGLTAFRRLYRGKLWLEVMLVKGLNDTEAALQDLAQVLSRVEPDEVHLNTPIRPPAEPWVEPPDEAGLARATAILGRGTLMAQSVSGVSVPCGFEDVSQAVMAVITRHPTTAEDLVRILHHWRAAEIKRVLSELETGGQAQVVSRYGRRFWTCSKANYAPELGSLKT